jgi:RNA polymerase sigma-70 factor (ECF subfamily)
MQRHDDAPTASRDATVDRHSFDRLMLEHLPAAHRLAIRLSGTADAGEELVQEAMLRASRSWQSFRGEAAFTTWLFQIVINVFRDSIRRRPDEPAELLEQADRRSSDPRDLASGAELGALIAQQVSHLPPRQREVLILVAYEDVSIGEAAALLGISEQNVRTNLHFARQALRTKLAAYLGGEDRCENGSRQI